MKKVVVGLGVILLGSIILLGNNKKDTYQEVREEDLKSLAVFIKQEDGSYIESTSIPTSGYTLNESKSLCSNNAVPVWDMSDSSLKIKNLNKNNTNCYLYFDIYEPTAKDTILSNVALGTGTPDFSKTSCSSGCGEATVGLYSVEDDLGTSYYFRGDVENNYVSFAGFYWRIIRINGDGTTRMIYAGSSPTTIGTDDQLASESAFNTNWNDNAYVGYMYGSTGASTYAATHANTNNSTIKGELDTWYGTYLNKTGVKEYIDGNAGFCNDRQSSNSESGTYGTTYGYGTNTTYYKALNRLYTNKAPSLKCTNKSADLFTTSGSSQGNGKLSYPVGLITADEVAYAGGVYGTNNASYYLYTGQNYWTMSPSWFNATTGYAYVFRMILDGRLSNGHVDTAYGVRPVINLRADTQFSGTGLASDPFQIKGAI